MRTFGSPLGKIRIIGQKPLTKRQREQMFRPYAVEIGKLALEWNRLHHYLSWLFSAAIGEGENILVAYKIWHSSQSDRSQREMLRAAAEVTFAKDAQKPVHAKALDDTVWLLDRAQSLADRRNNALHSPFTLVYSGSETWVAPDTFLGHPRASKLDGKDVLAELKWYRDSATVLCDFAHQLFYCLKIDPWMKVHHAPHPWPERPKMPQLASSKNHKTKRHRTRAK